MPPVITLAIETSCDETAICLLETRSVSNNTEYRILANLIHSQIELHKKYGGVFPIMAKREHAKNIMPLLETAFKEASIPMVATQADLSSKTAEIKKLLGEKEADLLGPLLASPIFSQRPENITRIAVTKGPGLEPALWVGINLAKALGILWDIPVVGINHMEGHIVGSILPSSELSLGDFKKLLPINFPALALLISGGHTELVLVKKAEENNPSEKYEVIGRTRDDAVGEAFDKTARMLGLPYPGGPEISRLAEISRKENSEKKITLPRPMIHSHDLDFSFSGLKTAVLYTLRELKANDSAAPTEAQKKEIAREFEDAVTDVLVSKTEKAIENNAVETLIVGGGVIANRHILDALTRLAKKHSLPILLPPHGVSGDNALMIALAGALNEKNNKENQNASNMPADLRAEGNLSL